MKRIIFFSTLLFIVSSKVFSAPIDFMPVSIHQPDGAIINCFASGDEFFNWLHDNEGYTIIQADNGWYYYGQTVNDRVVPTQYIVGLSDPGNLNLTKWAKISAAEYKKRYDAMWAEVESMKAGDPIRAPQSGTMNNIVVYIRFADDTEFTTTRQVYDDKFNALTGSSMKSYFNETSYGMLEINSTHYPACAMTTNISYQDSHNKNYFQPYNATTNPNGYQNSTERREREHALLRDAIQWVNTNSAVPSGINLDMDNDGYVDNICFIIRGNAGGWADLLWAHKWALYTYTVQINGKQVWDYTFQPENQTIVRTLCHEMYHVIGAPDLYHYYFDTHIAPVAQWDIMGNGGGHMTAYMKWKYSGETWITDIPEITSSGTYTLNPLTSSTNNCFKIASPNSSTEFFVVEYRNKSGTFENEVPGSGLIIYRINPTVNGNSYGPPDEIYVFRPNGSLTVNGSTNSAHFSSAVGRTFINDTTNPSGFLSSGLPGGLNISGISTAGTTISFNVTIPNSFTVDLSSNPAGAGVLTGEGNYMLNDTVHLSATSTPGFIFESWKVNGNVISTDSIHSFIITSDMQIEACFLTVNLTVDIVVVNETPSSGVVAGGGTYNVNDVVVVIATPNSGFSFVSWKEGDDVISNDPHYQFIATTNHTLSATFNVITETNGLSIENINVYPNPATDILYCDGMPEFTQLIISDMQNRIVFTEQTGSDITGLDISALNSGVYTIKFLKEGKALTRSFIKN